MDPGTMAMLQKLWSTLQTGKGAWEVLSDLPFVRKRVEDRRARNALTEAFQDYVARHVEGNQKLMVALLLTRETEEFKGVMSDLVARTHPYPHESVRRVMRELEAMTAVTTPTDESVGPLLEEMREMLLAKEGRPQYETWYVEMLTRIERDFFERYQRLADVSDEARIMLARIESNDEKINETLGLVRLTVVFLIGYTVIHLGADLIGPLFLQAKDMAWFDPVASTTGATSIASLTAWIARWSGKRALPQVSAKDLASGPPTPRPPQLPSNEQPSKPAIDG